MACEFEEVEGFVAVSYPFGVRSFEAPFADAPRVGFRFRARECSDSSTFSAVPRFKIAFPGSACVAAQLAAGANTRVRQAKAVYHGHWFVPFFCLCVCVQFL